MTAEQKKTFYIMLNTKMMNDGFKCVDGLNHIRGDIEYMTFTSELPLGNSRHLWLCEIELPDDAQVIYTSTGGITDKFIIKSRFSTVSPKTYSHFGKPLPKDFVGLQNKMLSCAEDNSHAYYQNYWPSNVKYGGQPERYFKIITPDMKHHDFTYSEYHMNVLKGQFNDNPYASCCDGRLYVTTLPYIMEFLKYGVWLYEVMLPFDDKDFKMIADPQGRKWGVNMLQLGTKFSLLNPYTYRHFGYDPSLALPTVQREFDLTGIQKQVLVNYWPKTVKYEGPDVTYYKVVSRSMKHHDFTYVEGLNTLQQEFNENVMDDCGPGGLYITDKEHLLNFAHYGSWVYEVTVPFTDPEFKMVASITGTKWRVNKLTLGRKFSLHNPLTLRYFDLPKPTCSDGNNNDLRSYWPLDVPLPEFLSEPVSDNCTERESECDNDYTCFDIQPIVSSDKWINRLVFLPIVGFIATSIFMRR